MIGTANDIVEIGGQKLRRPRGWSEARWSNSDRTPREHGITPDWYHVLDMSWTALLMLRWHEELEPDARLLDYARAYGGRLLELQDADGFFPGWLDPETHVPGPVMNRTPESSLSATFLLKLAATTGETRFREPRRCARSMPCWRRSSRTATGSTSRPTGRAAPGASKRYPDLDDRAQCHAQTEHPVDVLGPR